MLTLQSMTYIERNNQTGRPIWNYARLWLTKEVKPDRVVQLNCRKCAPIQVIKQPEHGRTSTTQEEK